jgi:hypothetical protein
VEVRFWECRRFGLGMVLNPLERKLSALSRQLETYSDRCQRGDKTWLAMNTKRKSEEALAES